RVFSCVRNVGAALAIFGGDARIGKFAAAAEPLDVHVLAVEKKLRRFLLLGLCQGYGSEKYESHEERFARLHVRPPRLGGLQSPSERHVVHLEMRDKRIQLLRCTASSDAT